MIQIQILLCKCLLLLATSMYFHAITYSAFRLSGEFVLGYAKSLSICLLCAWPSGGRCEVGEGIYGLEYCFFVFVAGHHAKWHESSR